MPKADTHPTPSRRLALRYGGLAALAGLITPAIAQAPVAVAQPHPDAELLRMGAELETEWARQTAFFENTHDATDEDAMEAMAPSRNSVQSIQDAKACTLAGLQVKALAIAWCCDDRERGIDGIAQFEPEDLFDLATTDERIAWSIVQDLLRMGRMGA